MQNNIHSKIISIAKVATICFTAIAILVAFILYQPDNTSDRRIVAITQIAQHPSLDIIRQGILDELQEKGFTKDKRIEIVYENAHGNISTAVQIAQKFVGMNPEVIVAISTPSAQTVQSAIRGKNIPLVFSAVTDPVGANLVKDLDKSNENSTGTMDLPPIHTQVELLKRLVPKLKRIGVIYNPAEINSIRQIEKLETIARKEGIEIVRSPATKANDMYGAAVKLAKQVDAFYLPNDNSVISALDSIVRVANEDHIPTVASDDQSVKHGVLASLANNQYTVGRDTGKLVTRILNGESAKAMPVVVSNKPELAFNESTAKKLKIDISDIKIGDLTQQR